MKIVNIIGGLGNQMFQYAFALKLKTLFEEDVYIDIQHFNASIFKSFKSHNLHNGYELDRLFYGKTLKEAKPGKIWRVSHYIPNYWISRAIRKYFPSRKSEVIEKLKFQYDPTILEIKGSKYYEGYWQSPLYFDDIRSLVVEEFRFPKMDEVNQNIANNMNSSNSVSLHVRRGDYINNPGWGGICTLDYYRKAIEIALGEIENPVFYIFSNDIEWCKENLSSFILDASVIYINHNKGNESYKDMQLMTFARCCIIANSSFSWWGAWLNNRDNKLIIAPKRWTNTVDKTNVYPQDWKLI